MQNVQKKNPYKISILMPIYNGIEFLIDSVPSVVNQSNTNWELIIGINGHKPNSVVYKYAKEYCKQNEQIFVYDIPETKSKSQALNYMVEHHVKGTHVAILDVDDIWLPTKLEKQIPYLAEYDVVGTKCKYFGSMDNEVMIHVGDLETCNFTCVNPIINSSVIIKKELAWWNDIIIEDYDLFLRLWILGTKMYNVNDVLINHRIHSHSAFNSKRCECYIIHENIQKLKNQPRIILFSCETS